MRVAFVYNETMSDKLKGVLEYSVVYPYSPKPDVDDIIQHLSRNTIINLVLVLTKMYCNAGIDKISYFFSDRLVLNEIAYRINLYCNPNTEYVFLPLQTALRILRKAVALPYVENDQFASETEMQLFKAILCINEEEMHIKNMPNKVAEMVFIQSLVTNSSNTSDNLNKVRALLQSYSAYQFFKFLEAKIQTDSVLKQIYDTFLRSYGITNGMEYILTLFGIVTLTRGVVGKIPKSLAIDRDRILSRNLMDALTLDLSIHKDDRSDTGRDNNIDYRTFRDKPFIRDLEGNYVVYWMEAVIDRMYNSLYFDFNDINNQLGLDYPMRKLFTDEFAEKYLFHNLMSRTNTQGLYESKYNTIENDNGKADYVLKRNNTIILFECKDIRISGDIIESHDGKLIIEEFRNKFFSKTYNKSSTGEKNLLKKPKAQGVGQLIEYMRQVRDGDSYYGGTKQSVIYPVLIVSDYKLLQRGIQQIMDEWYAERKSKTHYDKPLVVMSFITLIKSYPLFARNGFECYFDRYRDFISKIQNPADLQRYMTFDDYMQDYGESMDISEIRDEFINDITRHYRNIKMQ